MLCIGFIHTIKSSKRSVGKSLGMVLLTSRSFFQVMSLLKMSNRSMFFCKTDRLTYTCVVFRSILENMCRQNYRFAFLLSVIYCAALQEVKARLSNNNNNYIFR